MKTKYDLLDFIILFGLISMIVLAIIVSIKKTEFPSDNKINYKDDLVELNNVG